MLTKVKARITVNSSQRLLHAQGGHTVDRKFSNHAARVARSAINSTFRIGIWPETGENNWYRPGFEPKISYQTSVNVLSYV